MLRPGAMLPIMEGQSDKKAGRAGGVGAVGEPVEVLSQFRQDPDAERIDSGV